jgi:hypothetical protein
MTPPVPAWAIKAPDGKLLLKTIDRFEDGAWMNFMKTNDCSSETIDGYRCVRVEVRESEEG